MDSTWLKSLGGASALLTFLGCSQIPDGIEPVKNFDVARYAGTWFEVARLDHSFERGLSNVTATYAINSDQSIAVTNRGYSEKKQQWNAVKGRAKFVGDPDVAAIKVSFFGPFYGAYNVIDLDTVNYQYALVCGGSTSYLWILSRVPNLSEATYHNLIEKANAKGFDTNALIRVKHDRPQP